MESAVKSWTEPNFQVKTFFDFQVYDGATQNDTELIRHCGSALPDNPVIRSSGNQMFIRMRSDGSIAGKGFKAQYVKGK